MDRASRFAAFFLQATEVIGLLRDVDHAGSTLS
jgi:hypothetical protein